ncbi:hypothetical protein AB0L80_36680, partial [Streptomyces sp. NPDC052069]|uniref:hypothetical protein n=1 Tax=Streptomyces sp. NPDC052069 TaxID=3154650 RepID=UPI00343B0386
WENALHNQSALWLKSRLLFTPGVVVISVPCDRPALVVHSLIHSLAAAASTAARALVRTAVPRC